MIMVRPCFLRFRYRMSDVLCRLTRLSCFSDRSASTLKKNGNETGSQSIVCIYLSHRFGANMFFSAVLATSTAMT